MRHTKTLLVMIITILSSCECGQEELEQICPQPEPCYIPYGMPNVEKNIITGERLSTYEDQVCEFGTTHCFEETKEIVCSGVTYPQQEICDGKDNDCNGYVDDGDHLLIPSFHWYNPCRETQKGVCRYSDAQCVNGDWYCIPASPFYGEEVCDNRDNDCDGEVDEDIPDTFVYDGPLSTLNVGECRAGLSYCEEGREVVFGMRTPTTEICGNGDDDDCDGFTDEREENVGPYDFALVIDFSGSMYSYIDSVATALCTWSANQNFVDSRFAIISVAIDDNEYGIIPLTDFTDAQTACNILLNLLINQPHTMADEYQVDAAIRSIGLQNDLGLTWSHRTKKIVIFSDEEPQYSSYFGFNDLAQAIGYLINKCNTESVTVSVFTQWSFLISHYWNDVVNNCNGYLEYLTLNPQMMIEKLNYWFGEEC